LARLRSYPSRMGLLRQTGAKYVRGLMVISPDVATQVGTFGPHCVEEAALLPVYFLSLVRIGP
jgi:hypothetical protein